MKTIAVDGRTVPVADAFQKACNLLQEGRFAEVGVICEEIVAIEPDHFRAHHGLGISLLRTGRPAESLPHIRRALELNPAYFEAHNNLGNALRELGQFEEALEEFRRAAALRPEAAIACLGQGNALYDLGRPTEALARYEHALALEPSYVDAHFGRARCLYKLSRWEEAVSAYRDVVSLRPAHAEARYGLGMALSEAGRGAEAVETWREAIAAHPAMRDAYLALGNYLSAQAETGDPSGLDEAIACYGKVTELDPADGNTHSRLGNMLLVQGRIDEALAEYRLALHHKPGLVEAHSCLLMSLQYHPAPSLDELFQESVRWHRKFAAPVPKLAGHRNTRDPDRPLRVGYVSADFRRHPVGFHLMPVLYHHDAVNCEVFCYSNNTFSDIYTDRMRSYADGWREIAGLSDEAVQELIVADGIDVLVDLAGHTGGNRLLLFARRPAPVQVTWLGYFFSTGLAEIDYILMDGTAVLPGEERFFSEKVIRLPGTRFCYEPVPYAPDVAPLPCLKNGWITFGSFNNLAKVTPEVLRLWARVLHDVPDSRLLLKSPAFQSSAGCDHFVRQFSALGVAPDRLVLRGQSEHMAMLGEYADMDIALDPFPFNGGITSCEALWMGVPVLTLAGNRPIARQTTGFLRGMGLTDFIAQGEDDYVELASRWGARVDALAEVRSGLRRRMAASPLCDGKTFAANLERAYRDMWRAWCAS